MNLTRHALTAGLVALSIGLAAAPADAKGGGDINNTVVSIAPGVTPTSTTSGGGGGRALRCAPTGGIDPITGSTIMVCTSARA